MVAHPSYSGGRDRRLKSLKPACAKVRETLSQKQAEFCWLTSVIPANWEVEVIESWSKANPGEKCETLSEK
jgi:hypothetical protein